MTRVQVVSNEYNVMYRVAQKNRKLGNFHFYISPGSVATQVWWGRKWKHAFKVMYLWNTSTKIIPIGQYL